MNSPLFDLSLFFLAFAKVLVLCGFAPGILFATFFGLGQGERRTRLMKLRILLWSLLTIAIAASALRSSSTLVFADGSEPMPVCRGKQCK